MQLQRALVGRLAVLTRGGLRNLRRYGSSALAGGVPSRDYLHRQHLTGVGAEGQLDDVRRGDDEYVLTGTDDRRAAITPPLGFRVTGASLPAGAKGHVYVLFNVVLLDHVSVAPGSTLHVAVTATAPSRCNTLFTRWFTVATGGRFGELMFPDPSSSLTTDVTCANPAAGVDFVAQPTNSTVNQDITPPVTVQLVDSARQPGRHLRRVRDAGAGQQFWLGHPQRDADKPTNASGVATFSDLSINDPGFGYTLTASSTGLTGATSNPFSESNTETTTLPPCTIRSPCTTDLRRRSATSQISAMPAGTINESVDVGKPLSCPNEANGDYTGFDPNTMGSLRQGPSTRPSATSSSASTSDQTSEVV